MGNYLAATAILHTGIKFLLLISAQRLTGSQLRPIPLVLGALLGGLYSLLCLCPGFSFLGNTLWYPVFLGLMALLAYGLERSALRPGAIFCLLSLALEGIAGKENPGAVIPAVLLLCVLTLAGLGKGRPGQKFLPVKLSYQGKEASVVALVDTGNTLRDPITGEGVLVVSAPVAQDLLGLTRQQLSAPLQTLSQRQVPGLRLIPYRSVGQGPGFLLGLRMTGVQVDGRKVNAVVAFAPTGLEGHSTHQALLGGSV